MQGYVPRIRLALAAMFIAAAACLGLAFRHPARPTASLAPPAAPARTLTVTFWNLEWFPGRRPNASEAARQKHITAVVPVVQRLDPDVLGLIEVNDWNSACLVTDQLPDFHLDVCSVFTRPDGSPSGQQIALGSRLPLVGGWWEPWQPRADGLRPRRGFAFAAYQSAPDELLLVYALHLKSNVSDEPGGEPVNFAMREESARQLLAHQQAMAAAYARMGHVRLMVIGGDCNTSLDDRRFEHETTLRSLLDEGGFLWAWRGVPLERRLTLSAKGRYPAACFDHQIYRSSDSSARLLAASVDETGREASDHRPVTVKYTW